MFSFSSESISFFNFAMPQAVDDDDDKKNKMIMLNKNVNKQKFQIHQTKKSNKWQCKLCGEKQSIKRHYGLDNGKECRLHVQRLNALRRQTEENKHVDSLVENDDFEDYDEEKLYKQVGNKSKWSTYVKESEEILLDENNPTYLENDGVPFEMHTKRKKDNLIRKKLCKENLQCKGIEIIVHDNVKENNSTENEKDFTENPNNNLTINYEISKNKTKKLLSNKERNYQELLKKTWTKFVDSEDNLKGGDESQMVKNTCMNDPHKIFECCDDSELDLVLNI